MKKLINVKCDNFVNLIENERIKEDNYYYIIREYCFGNLDNFKQWIKEYLNQDKFNNYNESIK